MLNLYLYTSHLGSLRYSGSRTWHLVAAVAVPAAVLCCCCAVAEIVCDVSLLVCLLIFVVSLKPPHCNCIAFGLSLIHI